MFDTALRSFVVYTGLTPQAKLTRAACKCAIYVPSALSIRASYLLFAYRSLYPTAAGMQVWSRGDRALDTHCNPSTALTSSPDVSLGNALILVQTSRYELGQPCPKFSGLPAVLVTFFPFSKLFVYISMHQPCLLVR